MNAIVIVDHGSTRSEANESLFEVVALVQNMAPDVVVEGAHMELAPPTLLDAIQNCVKKGATQIQVLPYMLAPGKHATKDIPNMTQDAAKKFPGISIKVTPPLGVDQELARLILKRCKINKSSL